MASIVIVEDEIPVLTLAESILQAAGHETRTAATAAEAQAIIQSEQWPTALLFEQLLDWRAQWRQLAASAA